ncbi:hypothetical protein C8R43DRAFT_956361 [Mycena crocata]|nr:hypothetical protein C8R43DRAFT_956361 [Mycena crocata]
MTPPILPQELLEGIISEVDDFDSLKACSLAASRLTERSQRILLRSLTLSGWSNPPNYIAAWNLLEESPHIAPYITHLKILPRELFADFESLERVLAKLAHVQHCDLDGRHRTFRWRNVTPRLISTFIDFFARQPLRHLRLTRMEGISHTIFLGAAPSLCFFVVSVANAEDVIVDHPPFETTLNQLVVDVGSDDIPHLLTRPQLVPYTVSLGRLSIDPVPSRNFVRFSYPLAPPINGSKYTSSPPPPSSSALPNLRTAEFVIHAFHQDPIPWMLTTTSACILAPHASPALVEVVFTYLAVVWQHERPPELDPMALPTLDAALVGHPAAPRILWRRFNSNMDNGMGQSVAFMKLLQGGLPRTREAGRLMFEESERMHDHRRFDLSMRR